MYVVPPWGRSHCSGAAAFLSVTGAPARIQLPGRLPACLPQGLWQAAGVQGRAARDGAAVRDRGGAAAGGGCESRWGERSAGWLAGWLACLLAGWLASCWLDSFLACLERPPVVPCPSPLALPCISVLLCPLARSSDAALHSPPSPSTPPARTPASPAKPRSSSRASPASRFVSGATHGSPAQRTQTPRISNLRGAVLPAPPRPAQVVSLHCNLDATTRHLMNKERLGLMKPDAVLVNAARGPCIDEVALVEHLKAHPHFRVGA